MAGYIRLQELCTLTADTAQRLDHAVDVGDFNRLIVQVRTSMAGNRGDRLYLQHAAALEEDAFEDLCPEFWLSAVGSVSCAYTNPLRFIRWRAQVSGTTAFLVDVVGRQV